MANSYLDNHPFLIEAQDTGNVYYIKCISSITANRQAVVTQYPTVSGKSISDNMYLEPKSLNIQMSLGSFLYSSNKVVTPESRTYEPITVEDLKQLFKDWQTTAIRLNITTFEDYFENLVLNNITSEEINEDGLGTTKFSLAFTEVRIAQVVEIKLEFPNNSQESANNNDEQNLGADNGASSGEIIGEVGRFVGNVGTGALGGAALGAVIGSVGGPIGTAAGAIIGGALGFFNWLLN